MKTKITTNSLYQRGFSLLAALVTVAVLAIVAGAAYTSINGAVQAAKAEKLKSDVSNLNSALRVYQANGGKLGTVTNPQAIIDKLKTKTTATQRTRMVGLSGAVVDPRLVAVMQTEAEANSKMTRAIWDNEKRRFVLATSGGVGIKELELDESLSAVEHAEEDRRTNLQFAKDSTWVWDYQDRARNYRSAPHRSTLNISAGHSTLANQAYAQQLQSPIASVDPGTHQLGDYPMSIELTDPNPEGSAQIFYSTDSANWIPYEGGGIHVEPGETLLTQAVTSDPDYWNDSELAGGDYKTVPVELQVGLAMPKLAVNYAEAGGAMIGGDGSAAINGLANLLNGAEIPAYYQNDSVFSIHWTYDGSDPLSSLTGVSGAPFANGFVGQEVDFGVDRWGGSTSLSIKLAAKSNNSMLVTDSAVVDAELTVDPLALRQPLVTDNRDGTITLALDSGYGDTPEGARIYYTLDGTEPKVDSTGEPVGGIFYDGNPVDLPTITHCGGLQVEVKARTYGKSGFGQWFEVSDLTHVTILTPPLAGTPERVAWNFKQSELVDYALIATDVSVAATSKATVYGNVGVAAGTSFDFAGLQIGAGGEVFVDPGAMKVSNTAVSMPGGEMLGETVQDMSSLQKQITQLNLEAATLAADESYASLGGGKVISGHADGGFKVIEVGQLLVDGGQSLTLAGDADDYFIINITDSFVLNGGGYITTEGVPPSHILWNIVPGAAGVTIDGNGSSLAGTVMAPNSPVIASGTADFFGMVITGAASEVTGTAFIDARNSMFGLDCEASTGSGGGTTGTTSTP